MSWSACRKLVSCLLLLLFPASLFAADSSAAMLYTKGAAWVNGSPVPHSSSAIFSGDLLQTRSDTVANINVTGSTITVMTDSVVKFEGSSFDIQHGGITVSTSKGLAASAGDVKIAPAKDGWTEFNVVDLDGTVKIAANKGDLTISDSNGTATLAQGQQTTRDESSEPQSASDKSEKKKRKRATGATPAAQGGLLSTPILVGAAAGTVAGIATWVLIQGDNPASPSKP